MNKEHLAFKLYEWEKNVRACDRITDRITNLFGCDYEAPALKPYTSLVQSYTRAIAEIVGDKAKWLEYYHYDCNLGETPMKVTYKDGKTIMLESVEKLAEIILTP
jgi:oligoendopeptidase F